MEEITAKTVKFKQFKKATKKLAAVNHIAKPKKEQKQFSMMESLLSLDAFPQSFFFQLPNKRDSLPSRTGLIFTILLSMILGVYSWFELLNLKEKGQTRISSHDIISSVPAEKVFDLDKLGNGLEIAFGLTAFDKDPEMINEPDYATVKAFHKTWTTNSFDMEKIQTRPCTQKELGLGPEGFDDPFSRFYPIFDDYRDWFEFYWQKLSCIDDKVTVHGDYNSHTVSHFQIHLVKCDPDQRTTCKSEEEITEWLKRKFIIVVNNQRRFNQHEYGVNKVTSESLFTWFPIKSTDRQEKVNVINSEELLLQDKTYQFSDLTEEDQ